MGWLRTCKICIFLCLSLISLLLIPLAELVLHLQERSFTLFRSSLALGNCIASVLQSLWRTSTSCTFQRSIAQLHICIVIKKGFQIICISHKIASNNLNCSFTNKPKGTASLDIPNIQLNWNEAWLRIIIFFGIT